MNKYKKIAMSAVAVVMAGAMLVPLAACKRNRPNDDRDYSFNWDEKPTHEAGYAPKTKEGKDNQLTYTMDKSITLNMNVGNQNSTAEQGITYRADKELSGTAKMPDGKSYAAGDLKPAWAGLSEQLKVGFNDVFTNKGSAAQITDAINGTITNYDVITGSVTEINKNADYFLDLNQYMYYMPNYKAFLQSNPVAVFSLTGNDKGGMYIAPYFDGNDDIEKYELMNKKWVDVILGDGSVAAATDTFKAQADAKSNQKADGSKASATSYMGTTGSWQVDTTDPADATKTIKVTVDYNAALTAAKDKTTPLGAAIEAAAGKVYDGASGNIVDLQNFAINAKSGAVTGAQLIAILRAYVDVAYKNGNNKMYANRADVFNSASAAWDVDLMVAMMRCVVTGTELFGDEANTMDKVFGLTGRQDTTQRTVDLYALGGELYGIRGMESRYEYTYINGNGELADARQNAESYDLLAKMGALADEGLLYVCATGDANQGTGPANGKISYNNTGSIQSFMLHDYVQTQTKAAIDGSKGVPEDYNFAPVVTPVSKWDVDGNASNGHEEIMRFTESWRSVKNTGFCIPKASVKDKPEKLSAVLAFIDYLFSADGQILMTYGPMSTTGNTNPDGWWYATESSKKLKDIVDSSKTIPATDYAPAQYTLKASTDAEKATKKQVFVYNGKVYEGLAYADRNIPQMTTANKDFYLGKAVNGSQQGLNNIKVKAIGDYTGYARKIVGTTLPIGNKDQGFEYQATAQCGLDGAAIVATAINNGTIKHVKLTLTKDDSLWYMSAPTSLPFSSGDRTTLNNSQQTLFGSKYFYNESKTNWYYNVFTDLVFFGFDPTHKICGENGGEAMKENGTAYVAWLNGEGLNTRISIHKGSWKTLDKLYKITDSEAK